MIKIEDVKYNCLYYKGDIPCIPNKKYGEVCIGCRSYRKIEKRILIIKLGAIGDVIRTTPLLTKYRQLYPDSHITWITNTPEILPAGRIDWLLRFDYAALYNIENSTFDIAVNLDKEKEASILLGKVKAKEKYGFSWDGKKIIGLSDAANSKILTGLFDDLSRSNTKSYQEEIFEICGFEFQKEPNLLNVNESMNEKWMLLTHNSNGKSIVGLNTGCGKRWATRMWPDEHWIQTIRKLQAENFYPVVLGGKDEHERNVQFSKETGAYYPGHFELEQFIAIINNCDIIVTAVSMALHLAVGLNKKIVLFNNIFNKNEFEMYGKGVILEPATGCDCYYGTKCSREKRCMFDISSKSVIEALVKLRNAT